MLQPRGERLPLAVFQDVHVEAVVFRDDVAGVPFDVVERSRLRGHELPSVIAEDPGDMLGDLKSLDAIVQGLIARVEFVPDLLDDFQTHDALPCNGSCSSVISDLSLATQPSERTRQGRPGGTGILCPILASSSRSRFAA
jgi:hypothetical protein